MTAPAFVEVIAKLLSETPQTRAAALAQRLLSLA